MIIIRNTQRSIPIDITSLEADSKKMLAFLGYQDFGLHIWITTDETVRRYNNAYRKKDKPTDILSFPYHPELKAGERLVVADEEDRELGDMIISAAYVVRDAQKYGVSFERRMKRLLVHGICHLLGYDHMNDVDYKLMFTEEKRILEAVYGAHEAAMIVHNETIV